MSFRTTSRLANVLSRFANVLRQFPRPDQWLKERVIHTCIGLLRIMAERTRFVHVCVMLVSFRERNEEDVSGHEKFMTK